jgi:PAS domain-containing protein
MGERRLRTELLEAQIETSPDGVLVVDDDGEIILWNRLFAEMWRVPPELLQSPDTGKMIEHVGRQLDDPDSFAASIRFLRREPAATMRDELRLVEGRTIERWTAPLRSAAGERFGRIVYFRDISDRKNAERELRDSAAALEDLYNCAPCGYHSLDIDGRIVRMNDT